MYLLDYNDRLIDAECSFGSLGGTQCILVESSGGADPRRGLKRRNPQYVQLVGTLFARLADAEIRITRIVLESKKVVDLPIADRTVALEETYPIDLKERDVDEFRRMLGRAVAKLHQAPNAKSGGNTQKRIGICLDRAVSLEQLHSSSSRPSLSDVDYAPTLTETEKVYVSKARRGQGHFREKLLDGFGGECPVTGIRNPDLLVASHIKPWRISSNAERLDPANGILLSVLADRLFDKGFITFDPGGRILTSDQLDSADRLRCGVEEFNSVSLSQRSQSYMAYHREFLYRR